MPTPALQHRGVRLCSGWQKLGRDKITDFISFLLSLRVKCGERFGGGASYSFIRIYCMISSKHMEYGKHAKWDPVKTVFMGLWPLGVLERKMGVVVYLQASG